MSNNITVSEAHVIRYMLNLEKRKCTVNSNIVRSAFVLVGFVVAVIRE